MKLPKRAVEVEVADHGDCTAYFEVSPAEPDVGLMGLGIDNLTVLNAQQVDITEGLSERQLTQVTDQCFDVLNEPYDDSREDDDDAF